MTTPFDSLAARIRSKTARVGIIGLGSVGLPLARAFTNAGFRVLGFDIDPHKVAQLIAGRSTVMGLPDHVISSMAACGFEATDRFDRLREADAVVVCVPTPRTDAREPDVTSAVHAARVLAAQLRPGQLVVLESTTDPSATWNNVLPMLKKPGLTVGRDFFLAFSPAQTDPGLATASVHYTLEVVGGLDVPGGNLAGALYGAIIPQVARVSRPAVVEACKIRENTYRAVNIAS